MLVMVYLGGVGSLGGSILGATVFTVVLETGRLSLAGIANELIDNQDVKAAYLGT